MGNIEYSLEKNGWDIFIFHIWKKKKQCYLANLVESFENTRKSRECFLPVSFFRASTGPDKSEIV